MSDKPRADRPAWEGAIDRPVRDRLAKPRERGWTMVLDTGLGLHAVDDLMQVAAPAIDVVKLAPGTAACLGHDLLKEKVRTITAHGVRCMPDGALLEIAVWQGALERYLERARALGFDAIEVSGGAVAMDGRTRADAIEKAAKTGFRVLAAEAREAPAPAGPAAFLADLVNADLDHGAFMVLVGGHGAARGDAAAPGLPAEADLDALLARVREPDRILWEAPLAAQQRDLVLRFGPNVSLGDVAPQDVLALEALRCGLRGEPLTRAWRAAAGSDARDR